MRVSSFSAVFLLTGVLSTSIVAAGADDGAGPTLQRESAPPDAGQSRLLFAPTGRSLRKGEGYVNVHELTFPSVQVGVTDRFSIGGGTPLYFFDDIRPVWFTPKFQVVARDSDNAVFEQSFDVPAGGS